MTQEEAQAEAVRQWGSRAIAQPYEAAPGYVEIVLDVADLHKWDKQKYGPLTCVLGYGHTWEEAIENALAGQFEAGAAVTDPDALQYKGNKNENTPERTAEADKTPAQMRLFP